MGDRSPQWRISFATVLLAALCCCWWGCGSDKASTPNVNEEEARLLVASANDSLATVMDQMINELDQSADSSSRPGDYDFTEINALYEQALAKDPANTDAQFGVAFSGLMVFSTNSEFNELIDRFKYVYDTLTFNPFPALAMVPRPSPVGRVGHVGAPLTKKGLRGVLPALVPLDEAVVLLAATDPMISDIQQLLEAELLPKVISARQRLSEVLEDPDYTFILTPQMQGNEGTHPIVFDRADFHAFMAGLHAAEAALRVFFARDLDLPEYTVAAAEEALSRNSGFLDLKGDGVGRGHMRTAMQQVLASEAELQICVGLLLDEIGTDQSNDLIRVTERDREDLHDIKDSLAFYRTYFDGPKQLSIVWTDYDCYWDGHDDVCDETRDSVMATVDVRQFFENPMDNPKRFLPDYTVEMYEIGDDELGGCYEWVAGAYEDWTWPQPTFNGLLPGMTSTRLKQLMMDAGFEWQRSECWEGGFDLAQR